MIEPVCKNCGNKKSFTEDKIGRKYKCPECSETVTIESIGGNINIEAQESINVTDSYEKSIDEAEKREKDQKEAKEAQSLKWNTGCWSIFLVFVLFASFRGCVKGVENERWYFWISGVILVFVIYNYVEKKKLKND